MTDQYEEFLAQIRLAGSVLKGPLFSVAVEDLFAYYLDELPMQDRQGYNCRACKNFVERYGNLVTIQNDGSLRSPIWREEKFPEEFKRSVAAMRRAVERGTIQNVFLSSEKVWGTPCSPKRVPNNQPVMVIEQVGFATVTGYGHDIIPGGWRHMHVVAPSELVYEGTLLSAEQKVAEKLQDVEILKRGLAEFSTESVKAAKALLETEALYRGEKCVEVAVWLLELHRSINAVKRADYRNNLVWLAAGSAPPGWCHVRSTMIGTLLEDFENKLPYESIKKRFAEKMHPLQYKRPTATPSTGQINQAEKVIEKLAASGSLNRRFARLEDLQPVWTPKPEAKKETKSGVFSHLREERAAAPSRTGARVVMTWSKFAKTVLPRADRIHFIVPRHVRQHYTGFICAADAAAPNMLQWDNTVSWYCYNGGSTPEHWNLAGGTRVPVTAVVEQPSMWKDPEKFKRHGESVTMVLEGCYDTEYRCGAAFFPELLRNEYEGVSTVLEAHFKKTMVPGSKDATGCGIRLQKGGPLWEGMVFEVETDGVVTVYTLDRWD